MNILVFGLGNAGIVLVKNLFLLFKKYLNIEPNFIFIVRNSRKVAPLLSKYQFIFKNSFFLEYDSFDIFKKNLVAFKKDINKIDLCINASLPNFNNLIQSIAIELEAHYVDMASDMYNDTTISSLSFQQNSNNDVFRQINKFSLINIGVSPGLTNFLISKTINDLLLNNNENNLKIESIEIHLLENQVSNRLILSWAPQIAIEEYMQPPKHIYKGKLVESLPFHDIAMYDFPIVGKTLTYPIFQEEIISLHNHYPDIDLIRVYAGGSEVEFLKNLYLLGINKENLDKLGVSFDKIESLLNNVYKNGLNQGDSKFYSAQFCAFIDIKVRYIDNLMSTYKVGINFVCNSDLFNESTYIGYVTGISASILLFFTYQNYLKNSANFIGVLEPDYLGKIFDINTFNLILKELSVNSINYSLNIN